MKLASKSNAVHLNSGLSNDVILKTPQLKGDIIMTQSVKLLWLESLE